MKDKHKLAGKNVTVKCFTPNRVYAVEDYVENLLGKTARQGAKDGNPACLQYACRIVAEKKTDLMADFDNAVYIKSVQSGLGHIVHESEIIGVVE